MVHLDCEVLQDPLAHRVHRVSEDLRAKSDQRVSLGLLDQMVERVRQARRDQKAPMVRWVLWGRLDKGASVVQQV